MNLKAKNATHKVLFHLLLILLACIVLSPFVLMISGSLKTDYEMNNFPLRIIPQEFTLEHYISLFDTIPFWRQFFNSVFVSSICAFCVVFINGLVAYGFTRFDFKGRNVLLTMVISTMLIPAQVYLVPQFQMYNALGFFGTYFPLIIPSLMNAFGIFLLVQIMGQIPRELYESATIDGCGELRSFTKITIPLSVSGIGIQAILSFMASWNDFMTPLIYLNKEEMYTLPIGLMRLQDFYNISYGAPLAGAFLSCLPVIIILTLVGQKYFVQGLMAGAVKG